MDNFGPPAILHVAAPAPREDAIAREVAEKAPDTSAPVYARCIGALTDKDYLAMRGLVWHRALVLWLGIIQSCNFESQVGKHAEFHLSGSDMQAALEIIRDASGLKSPKTVLKRGQDLKRFVCFVQESRGAWWPVREQDMLQYMEAMARNEASKSTGKDLLSALRFYKYVLGAYFDLDQVLTVVTVGKSKRILVGRKLKKQARVLSVREVQRLEEFLQSGANVLDRCYAGCLLFAIYGRCSWSDLQFLDSLQFDVVEDEATGAVFGFVEGSTRVHKTGGAEEKKALYMPLVAPINGISQDSRGMRWKCALQELQLLPGESPFGPLCKAPAPGGGFARRGVSSTEAGNILNAILDIPSKNPQRTTSHAMKATTLSWCAKYGMDPSTRLVLGHHAVQGDSLACYSGDLISHPLREYCAMLLNISRGHFLPDSTRSRMLGSGSLRKDTSEDVGASVNAFASSDCAKGVERQADAQHCDNPATPGASSAGDACARTDENAQGNDAAATDEDRIEMQESSDSSYSSSSSSEDGESEGEEQFHEEQCAGAMNYLEISIPGRLAQNNRSKMLHRLPDEVVTATVCGIKLSKGYSLLLNGSRFFWPRCARCFKGELIDTPDKAAEVFRVLAEGREQRNRA